MIPSLFQDFIKFKNIVNNHDGSNILNLKMHSFLGAGTLLPLLNYTISNGISKYIPSEKTKDYLDKILGRKNCANTTIPFEELPTDFLINEIGDFSDRLISLLKNYVDRASFDLLLYELMNNIYEHSNFNNAYAMAQQYPNENITDICIIDDGITIPGNFENSGITFENDAESIFQSINGRSTDKYDYKIRGYGLNTTTQISTLCFKEEMLIASRGGLCAVTSKGAQLYDIDDNYVNGTYIGIRINENIIGDLSPYYSDKRKIKKIGKTIYL